MICLVQRRVGILPALQPVIHIRKADINLAVVRSAFQKRFHLLKCSIGLPHVRQLAGVDHLQPTTVWKLLGGFTSSVGRFLPFFVFAIGVDDRPVTALRVLVPQRKHFLESFNRGLFVVVVLVGRAQPFEENGAVVLFFLRKLAIRFLGLLEQVLQGLYGFVIATLYLINRSQIVRDLLRILHHGLSFFQVLQREIELALAAIDFAQANVRASVFGVRIGNDFVLLKGLVGLTVVQQALGQSAHRVKVIAVERDCVLVSVNCFFIIFLLIVSRAEY